MVLKNWGLLPEYMRTPEVKPYYDLLKQKQFDLIIKRVFDLVVAIGLLAVCAIPMLLIAILIKLDSKGPVFYRQERITTYGKHFRIHKFRTMVDNAERLGNAVTVGNDQRITKIGRRIRSLRLDELPQLIDILQGNMTFVGTRPEAVKYVEKYQPEMYATLLLPAGITSEASILYKDEERLLSAADDVDRIYLEQVLPEKMKYNLESLRRISFWGDIKTMVKTVLAVLK